jgi:hypothetical protein
MPHRVNALGANLHAVAQPENAPCRRSASRPTMRFSNYRVISFAKHAALARGFLQPVNAH